MNYEVYTNGLDKSLKDKLFFEDKIDLHNKIIIDFGCAHGTLIKELAPKYPDSNFIGIDQDNILRNKAIELNIENNNTYFDKNLDVLDMKEITSQNKEIIIILSSVCHELGDYQYKLLEFIDEYCDYIIIRDMYFNKSYNKFITQEELSLIYENSDIKKLLQFIAKGYGIPKLELIYHWLLKYRYSENWEHELKEDYFSTKWDIFEEYTIIYDYKYTHKFTKEQVKKDFDIDLKLPTHREMILKVGRLDERRIKNGKFN